MNEQYLINWNIALQVQKPAGLPLWNIGMRNTSPGVQDKSFGCQNFKAKYVTSATKLCKRKPFSLVGRQLPTGNLLKVGQTQVFATFKDSYKAILHLLNLANREHKGVFT